MAKHPGGRPRKITNHIARKIFVLYAYGLTDQQIADVFDVHLDTIKEFKKEAEYSTTITKIKNEADLRVANSLYLKAIGHYPVDVAFCYKGEVVLGETFNHPPSEGAAMMWLTNRRRAEWQREAALEEKPKAPMVRVFEKIGEIEMAVISRGDSQVDVLLGKDFVDKVKAETNGHSNNGTGRV